MREGRARTLSLRWRRVALLSILPDAGALDRTHFPAGGLVVLILRLARRPGSVHMCRDREETIGVLAVRRPQKRNKRSFSCLATALESTVLPAHATKEGLCCPGEPPDGYVLVSLSQETCTSTCGGFDI